MKEASASAPAYRLQGSGPILVCHPGGPGYPASYVETLGGLDRTRSLVLVDPRGTGRSPAPSDPARYRLDDYVADLEALRVELGLETMELLGHSAGGWIAVRYAAEHPGRLSRLILCETLLRPISAPPLERYFGRFGEREASFLKRLGQPNPEAIDVFRQVDSPVLDLRPLLPSVECPTLVVWGGEGVIVSADAAHEAARLLPSGRAVAVPGSGHFPWVEAPEAFAALVSEFLDEGPAQR